MKICEILKNRPSAVSFEFMPPKTPRGWENLFKHIDKLQALNPAYVSVTYGAGGSTRDRTHELVKRITTETNLEVVAHLTCVGATKDEVAQILDDYEKVGVHNILALRGDLPEGMEHWNPHGKGFDHASDLVEFIRKEKPNFGIGAAAFPEGHPGSPNRLKEMDYLKLKVDAGVDYLVTQLFFDNRDFYDFKERCELKGINVPIVAGIMPITSRKSMTRMADLAPNSRFPAPLIKAVDRAQDDSLVEKVGVHWATEQVRDLMDKDVDGIHLYTLNQSVATLDLCATLGLNSFPG